MGRSKKPADNSAAASAPASPVDPVEDPPSSSSRPSFLSRLSLPLAFRSRTRNIADFHIRPAEPHRKYGAGDHVRGAVILTVVKPVRITHLVVSLHGYMRVYKGPGAPANEPVVDPAEVPTTTGRSSRQKGHPSGYVRLFQDEQPLSADGRLEPGRYEFNFDLLFPADGLPSSIDFERGTISYMITATLTRPTSIGTKIPPKSSCERKIYLVEKVDVGPLAAPRPSTIYLEPISKRPKKRRQPAVCAEKTPAAVDAADPASEPDSTRANENSTDGSLSAAGEDQGHDHASDRDARNQSDVRSVSSDSAISRSTGPSRAGDSNSAVVPSAVSPSVKKKACAVKDRTITATVELQRGGCLPGDVVPIRVAVQHIRRITSIHGVIVTLYRLGRIDSSPGVLSKEPSEAEARRADKDEYYPKSKTGLGGLSLSAAGSCSVFRKDLSQSISPLVIDPDSLTATLTTSVRVPEDVFPTIKGVPYEMITFKYHVEVIVDLGGKLASQIQGGKPSAARLSTVGGPLGLAGVSFDSSSPALASWGTGIIDTDRLRRQKGVISVVFEVVVGTTDSSRFRGKAPLKPTPSIYTVPMREAEAPEGGRTEKRPGPVSPGDGGYAPAEHLQDYGPSPAAEPTYSPDWDPAPPAQPPPSAPHYIPPPEVVDESALPEKERIRRAEQRLLPSQPPPAPVALAGPSSPRHLPNGENIYDADDDNDREQPPLPVFSSSHFGAPPDPLETPSAPTLDDLAPPAGPSDQCLPNHHHPTEDKQELERRRLLAEASAPPEFPDDYDDNANSDGGGPGLGVAGPSAPPPSLLLGTTASPPREFEPSAPVLLEDEGGNNAEEDAYGRHYAYADASPAAAAAAGGGNGSAEAGPLALGAEPLPRYEG